jgi:hypothetical protein
MAIIETERNRVYAYEPQPDDVFLRVGWGAPGDGRHLRTITLPYQPISSYRATVDWAVSIADQMAYPIHVVTLNSRDMRVPGRFKSICDAVSGMTDQEHGEMRGLVIATCAEVMRDCGDRQVRADAYNVLVQLKVVREMTASVG